MDEVTLLVESQDDEEVIRKISRHHQLPLEHVEFRKCGNDVGVIKTIEAAVDEAGLEKLGIVVDADDKGPQSRWNQISYRLRKAGYTPPKRVLVTGMIVMAPRRPVAGAWIMPDNLEEGSVESFLARLISDDDDLWPRARSVVDDIPEDQRRFPGSSGGLAKAEIHTWLAWQKEPGRPLSRSITSRYLDPEAELARRFVTWLRRLLGAAP